MTAAKIITLGCRLNRFESEIIGGHARDAGLTATVIINTCAVTAEAERQARQTIRRARRDHPDARIIVTGCAAQLDGAKFAAMADVDLVIGNKEKLDPGSYLPQRLDDGDAGKIRVSNIMDDREKPDRMIAGFEGRQRAFVQIQQGCDHRCSFCIIPFARGVNRGVGAPTIIDQARKLTANGFREIVLTGVDISSYGMELSGGPRLGKLIRRLLAAVPELERLRLGSLDPAVVDEDLMEVLAAEPRLMPHLHLSVQSGNDIILKRMKRRHLRADVVALAARLRDARPDIVLGADMIAGFPTESDEMFEESLSLIGEAGLTYLHVFPFSPRPGTPAARMPNIAAAIRRGRAAALRQAGAAARHAYFESRIGHAVAVLAERNGSGYCRHYAPVRLNPGGESGTIVAALVSGHDASGLIAEPVAA